MGVSVTPPTAVNLADNPKNRLYRATQSGTYTVNIPVGVYEVTRQATTNIIIGSTTIVPSTMMSLIFVNEQQNSITFNSTVSTATVPWTNVNVAKTGDVEVMQFINGTYFISPTSGFVYSVSTDAVTWTTRTYYNVNDEGAGKFISFGNGRYVQPLGWGSNGPNRIRQSTDLLNWGGVAGQLDRRFWDSKFGAGRFVLVGSNVAQNTGWIQTSTDGVTWNAGEAYNVVGPQFFTTIEFNGSVFVAGGTSGIIFTSTNGTSWTYRNSLFAGNDIRKILWGNNTFLAVGGNGTIATSTNGETWTLRPSPGTLATFTNAAYDSTTGVWVISDGGTTMRISTDLNTWQTRNPGGDIRNYSLMFANGKFFHATYIDSNNVRVYSVAGSGMLNTAQSVPFTDTYIILDYKGKTRVLS